MSTSIKNAIKIEKRRCNLAKEGNIKELLNTYSGVTPEIPNFNTPRLWDNLNKRGHIDRSEPMAFNKLTVITKKIPNKPIKLLNIACGSGDLEHFVFNRFRKNKIKWHGIDISSKSIKSCKKEFIRAYFSVGDAKKLKFKNEIFDIVTALEILEHISPKDIFVVLGEIHRVLKRKGKFIISIPLNEGLEKYLMKGKNPNAHVRIYTPELIEAELKIANFEVKEKRLLYAFNSFYFLKSIIAKFILKGYRKPNSIIVIAKKRSK